MTPEVTVESADRDPGASVFTAIAGPRVGSDIPIQITRWFKGMPPAGPVAAIKGQNPDDLCGPTSPPAGGEYLFVTYTFGASRLTISGCSPQVDVTTREGAALLALAVESFGPGIAPPPEAPPPEPSGQTSSPSTWTDQMPALVPMVVIAVLAAMLIMLGLIGTRRIRRG